MTITKTIRRDKLAFEDADALQALCGSNNSRLKLVERTAGASVHLRGNEITIEADESVTRIVRSARSSTRWLRNGSLSPTPHQRND